MFNLFFLGFDTDVVFEAQVGPVDWRAEPPIELPLSQSSVFLALNQTRSSATPNAHFFLRLYQFCKKQEKSRQDGK